MLVKGMRRVGVLKIVILVLFLVMGIRHAEVLVIMLWVIEAVLKLEVAKRIVLEMEKNGRPLVCVRGPKIW